MKKLKVMLLSLALVAVVGGALAFKATYRTSYCTAATDSGTTPCPTSKACSTKIDNQSIGSTGTFVCTALPENGSCSGINCVSTSAQLVSDGGGK